MIRDPSYAPRAPHPDWNEPDEEEVVIPRSRHRIAEARRDGIRAAGDGMTRGKAMDHALSLTINEGDAFLAGYYTEIVRLSR